MTEINRRQLPQQNNNMEVEVEPSTQYPIYGHTGEKNTLLTSYFSETIIQPCIHIANYIQPRSMKTIQQIKIK